MSDNVIFSQPYGSVLVDASVPCVITQWHAFANTDQYIRLIEAGLHNLEAHSTPEAPWGWIGDTRQMSVIPARALAWLVAEFNPRATDVGLRQVSVVVSENVFGQVSTQQYAQQTAQGDHDYVLPTVVYDSLESAKEGARAALRHD